MAALNSLLPILTSLPAIIGAVEELFGGIPSAGGVKKAIVLDAMGKLIDSATASGLVKGLDKAATLATIGGYIDIYVTLANLLGWK